MQIIPSSTTPGVYGLVVVNPDGSNVGQTGDNGYRLKIYKNTYTVGADTFDAEYICEANPGTTLTAAAWRIRRSAVNNTTGEQDVAYADGVSTFTKAATDLATVAAYAYS